jgi:nucleoside triphosphatase
MGCSHEYSKYHAPEAVVACIIENKDHQVLFLRQSKWGNKWVIPGGHIRGKLKSQRSSNFPPIDKTLFDAVKREVEEETGFRIYPPEIDFMMPFVVTYPKGYCHPAYFIGMLYHATPIDNSPINIDMESDKYVWSTLVFYNDNKFDVINPSIPLTDWTRDALRLWYSFKQPKGSLEDYIKYIQNL